MSDEIRQKINDILTQVEELHKKQASLEEEKQKHLDLIKTSETEIDRINTELKEAHDNVLSSKIEMDEVNHLLFQLPENATPDPTVEAEDNEQGKESSAKRLWNQEAKRHKLTVA
jgi:outer membrane murein-binding lipoprotein Lpp